MNDHFKADDPGNNFSMDYEVAVDIFPKTEPTSYFLMEDANFDNNAYFDIFVAYLKPKFGTRDGMQSYFLEFIFSTGILLGVKFISCDGPRSPRIQKKCDKCGNVLLCQLELK